MFTGKSTPHFCTSAITIHATVPNFPEDDFIVLIFIKFYDYPELSENCDLSVMVTVQFQVLPNLKPLLIQTLCIRCNAHFDPHLYFV